MHLPSVVQPYFTNLRESFLYAKKNLINLLKSSELRISEGTTDGHFGPPWSFALILSMIVVLPCVHGRMTQKGMSRNSCLVPYTLQPFEALTPEGEPFEGLRAKGWALPSPSQTRPCKNLFWLCFTVFILAEGNVRKLVWPMTCRHCTYWTNHGVCECGIYGQSQSQA